MAAPQHRMFAPSDRVLSRELDGEAVLLDLASGTYFALDETGTVAWALLVGGASVATIAAALVARYDVPLETAQRDVESLLAELERRGLIREATPR